MLVVHFITKGGNILFILKYNFTKWLNTLLKKQKTQPMMAGFFNEN